MAGQNDFLIFDENKDNMLTQELYSVDGDRTDGFKKGLARSNVNNKVLHQTSKMCSAIGELIKGYDGTATDGGTLTELVDNVNGLFIFKPFVKSANFKKGVYVVGTVNENIYIAKSLIDNNTGHDLTDGEYWEEVKLGGGSGLEVGDIGTALYVDETKGLRRYLNGQIVDINTNTQAFLNRLKEITTLHPSLLCTEEEWQTAKTMSAFGQVGKFVFNYSNDKIVSVRIPRVVNVQGLFDLQNLGMTVQAGLPNITGSFGTDTAVDGAFYKPGGNRKGPPAGLDGTDNTVYFDASRSSLIYGKSNTVQPEAIQYPYFIQIATGSETEANIVNTLENVNGFTLLESKYSDKPLYNESWLLSSGQQNAKAVYPTVYEALQVEYNSQIEVGTTITLPSGVSYTKRGLSVKLSTETYTDYDFVLNTADETFRLPLKTKLASGNALYLYYYVGETVQNANLIDAGRIGEQLANKQDKCIHIIEPYVNGTSGYNIWSNGYCEQWGKASLPPSGTIVNLLKTYKDKDYNLVGIFGGTAVRVDMGVVEINTENSFKLYHEAGLNAGFCLRWKTSGYLAQGEY